MHASTRALASLLLGAAALAAARPCQAATCSSLALPNPVYVAGSGDIVFLSLAKALAAGGITVVYQSIPSCQAVDSILNGTKITNTAPITYYDSTGVQQQCTYDTAGQALDIGVSDVFATTCFMLPSGLPNGVRDFFGPVEAMTFIVPKKSSQKAISKAAAYFVYGFGGNSGVAPWTDPLSIFQRDPTSGTQNEIGVGIGVPPAKFMGVGTVSSADLVGKLSMAANPEAAIGIATAEVAEANTATVSVLAYRDQDQTCAYFPDSTQTAKDKINVRDGHYALWGPLHLHAQVDNTQHAVNPQARQILAYIEGTMPPPVTLDLIALYAANGLTPQCAMRVQRTNEIGALASFAPMGACGCYFEQSAAGTTTCQSCKADADCPMTSPRCSYGFCETQ